MPRGTSDGCRGRQLLSPGEGLVCRDTVLALIPRTMSSLKGFKQGSTGPNLCSRNIIAPAPRLRMEDTGEGRKQ